METIKIKDRIKDIVKDIKEKKESKLALFYSLFYFVFITLLLVFGSTVSAQTPVTEPGAAYEIQLTENETPNEVPSATYTVPANDE